jgi:hypothetical protein
MFGFPMAKEKEKEKEKEEPFLVGESGTMYLL